MELVIITGASRGLGRALALELASTERVLLTIARHPDPTLGTEAAARRATIEQWALDVAHDIGVATRLEAWLHQQDGSRFRGVALVNNAGLLGTVGPLEQLAADDLAAVLRVNLEAPMALTGAFLRATGAWTCPRKVLNISSGAGRNPIAGWAAYCASKAGLDHFSRVTALDEARKANGAKIVSLAPGVIDTAMQSQLRAADASGFPDKQRFLDLHANAQLAAPAAAAQKIAAYLARPDFGANPVADIRNA
jgi:NAD(P)-dependent dehydrogenase (short-subunit alcohol dehydrogenase family)